MRKVLSRLSGSLPKAGPVVHATKISLKKKRPSFKRGGSSESNCYLVLVLVLVLSKAGDKGNRDSRNAQDCDHLHGTNRSCI